LNLAKIRMRTNYAGANEGVNAPPAQTIR